MKRPWYDVRQRFFWLSFVVAIIVGGNDTIAERDPNVSGVPVAPGVVRYYEPATARHIYICEKPCAVVQGEWSAR